VRSFDDFFRTRVSNAKELAGQVAHPRQLPEPLSGGWTTWPSFGQGAITRPELGHAITLEMLGNGGFPPSSPRGIQASGMTFLTITGYTGLALQEHPVH
jgi:hypothetical protein